MNKNFLVLREYIDGNPVKTIKEFDTEKELFYAALKYCAFSDTDDTIEGSAHLRRWLGSSILRLGKFDTAAEDLICALHIVTPLTTRLFTKNSIWNGSIKKILTFVRK